MQAALSHANVNALAVLSARLRVQATKAAVRGLKQSVPQRRAELAKAEEDMAVAQRQSQEEGTTEEEREALLTRLQALTTREAQATERLQAETQVRALR